MAHAHTREEHPLPARLMHWAHLLSIGVLTLTGFFIHDPYANWPMWVMRQFHFWAMYLLVVVLVMRVYWAIFGGGSARHGSRAKVRDGKFFIPEKMNKGQLIRTVRYYAYPLIAWIPGVKMIGLKDHPPASKFNPLQKITYVFWGFLIVAQAIAGFAIYTPTAPYLAGVTYWLGGPIQMRVYHYLMMWIFIVTTLIHIYLSVAEDIGSLPLMLWGKETKPSKAEAR